MSHIALLHFTGPPAIGGVESVLRSQVTALTSLGHQVRVVVGRGEPIPLAEFRVVDSIVPAHDRSQHMTPVGRFPPPDDPNVRALAGELEEALAGCDVCWVHNVFTVYLNPALTVALTELTQRLSRIRWFAWCYDLTGTSRHQDPLCDDDMTRIARALPGVSYVTPTEARAAQLRSFLREPTLSVQVIAPPLAMENWLPDDRQTREIDLHVALFDADIVVNVPAKLLPHKRLERAVHAADALQQFVSKPLVLITGASSPHESLVSARVREELRELVHALDLGKLVYVCRDLIGADLRRKSLRNLFLLSDLVFLPSDEEGYGMPIAEAAALRVPVLCSNIAPFREVGAGWVQTFRPDEAPDSIARRMAAMAATPANAARRRALRTATACADRLSALLER